MKYALTIFRKNDRNQDELLITIIKEMPFTKELIFDYYAKEYAFEREKLSVGSISQVVDMTDIKF